MADYFMYHSVLMELLNMRHKLVVQLADNFLYHKIWSQLLSLTGIRVRDCGTNGWIFSFPQEFESVAKFDFLRQRLWYRWLIIFSTTVSWFCCSVWLLLESQTCGTDGGLFSVPQYFGSVAKFESGAVVQVADYFLYHSIWSLFIWILESEAVVHMAE